MLFCQCRFFGLTRKNISILLNNIYNLPETVKCIEILLKISYKILSKKIYNKPFSPTEKKTYKNPLVKGETAVRHKCP